MEISKNTATRIFGRDAGFTLIELMVVIVIIGLIAALVGPKFFGQLDKARQHDAMAQISLFAEALDLYRLEKHKYPTTQEGLDAIQPYLKKEIPLDPWGNKYVYRAPADKYDYEIISYGANGVEGGDGNDYDVISWKGLPAESK